MTKAATIQIGNYVEIVERKCLPMIQPKVKVGNRFLVIGTGEGFIKVPWKNKQKWTRLSLRNYEFRSITKDELQKELDRVAFREYMKGVNQNLTPEVVKALHVLPFICEVQAIDWSSRTRLYAMGKYLPFQKQSRKLQDVWKQYDLWLQAREKTPERAKAEREMVRTWRRKYEATDHQLLQLCKKMAKKLYPEYKHPDLCARAMASLCWIVVYNIQFEETRKIVKAHFPAVQGMDTNPLIDIDIRNCMLEYMPGSKPMESAQIDWMCKKLHEEIHEFTEKDITLPDHILSQFERLNDTIEL